jgi:hypothetical protein
LRLKKTQKNSINFVSELADKKRPTEVGLFAIFLFALKRSGTRTLCLRRAICRVGVIATTTTTGKCRGRSEREGNQTKN